MLSWMFDYQDWMVSYVLAFLIEHIPFSSFMLGGNRTLKTKFFDVNKNLQKDQPEMILTPFWNFSNTNSVYIFDFAFFIKSIKFWHPFCAYPLNTESNCIEHFIICKL